MNTEIIDDGPARGLLLLGALGHYGERRSTGTAHVSLGIIIGHVGCGFDRKEQDSSRIADKKQRAAGKQR